MEVSVKMTDVETGNDWLWDRNKFLNRKSIMKVSRGVRRGVSKGWPPAGRRRIGHSGL
jgi:hypothetical protein